MRNKEVEEAIDTLQNCIADYVIGDFCVGEYCPMENECKDKDCPFNTAIDKVIAYISELEETCKKQEHRIIEDDIPKQMIRDKIKELESYKGLVMYEKYNYELIITNLKELLGE